MVFEIESPKNCYPFLTFLKVISIFLGIENNPNKLYVFEKLRLSSRRWCYF